MPFTLHRNERDQPMQHDFRPVGNGKTMCFSCFATGREAAALGLSDVCDRKRLDEARKKAAEQLAELGWGNPERMR